MDYYQNILRPLLFRLPPEVAHNLAIKFSGQIRVKPFVSESLAQTLCGVPFSNPVGLSAGFDKNAQAIQSLSQYGFGFLEVGTVTPQPQIGNPKPRMFRLIEDEAVINRLGFNNKGLNVFCHNLQHAKRSIPVGANIGKNKDQTDAAADYITALNAVDPLADYITVNISSPNTQGLRALQEKDNLRELLQPLMQRSTKPLFVKVAPDLDKPQIANIAEIALELNVTGLIVSNTTIERFGHLQSGHAAEAGGLSGQPLKAKSTLALKRFAQITHGKLILIGVGGIASGADAYAKIKAGASLVQVYTALIYHGPQLINRINRELADLLAQDGFNHISEAIGIERHSE